MGSDGDSPVLAQSPADYSELNFRYHESGFHSLPFEGDLALSRTMQDSLWIRSKVDADIYYTSLKHKLGISLMNSSILPGHPGSEITRASDTGIGIFWGFKNSQGGRIPTSGLDTMIEYDYFPGANKDYGRLQGKLLAYRPIKGRFVGFLGLNYMNNENRNPPFMISIRWEDTHPYEATERTNFVAAAWAG
jgi:hypothetical protein